jgi:hypothetical protein
MFFWITMAIVLPLCWAIGRPRPRPEFVEIRSVGGEDRYTYYRLGPEGRWIPVREIEVAIEVPDSLVPSLR